MQVDGIENASVQNDDEDDAFMFAGRINCIASLIWSWYRVILSHRALRKQYYSCLLLNLLLKKRTTVWMRVLPLLKILSSSARIKSTDDLTLLRRVSMCYKMRLSQ
ncbi:hypothetical protein K7X08_029039 [Anisodus acutangulus]|uniref:Uncharacterized protein n=1 Tax=Anisodus acutangulus TaxID=402998 RepID=A0A9Q1QTE2_9SOLA|nr:hypothetical protein K7X08_029039 [Anisodus acutangulus]